MGIATFISCNKDFLEPLPENEEGMEKSILGKKLENPYSVTNMKKALDNIKANKKSSDIEIYTTHYYVKFKPKNEEELSILKRDTTIDLYDYPLDREVVRGQAAYHDPEISKGRPTYQYCAVNVDYVFPDVGYKILEELFIPEETDGLKSNSSFIDKLVDEALRITGNLEDGEAANNSNKSLLPSKWRPAGRILVWDDNLGRTTTTSRVFSHWEYYDCDGDGDVPPMELKMIVPIEQCKRAVYKYVTTPVDGSYQPVQGLIVRARRWFTTHKDDTDSRGYYSCDGEFRYDANYSIIWERYDFEIRKSWLGRAKYDGPKKRGDWDFNIRNGEQKFYSTIFRAAFHYYYGSIKGLRRPPQNAILNTQMKIRAFYEENSERIGSHSEERRFLGLASQLHIYNPQLGSLIIYASTIHELAHASHWNMWRNGNDFDDSDKIVKESWARGVQWELTRMVYTDYEGGATVRPDYTQVVVDMIDGPSSTDHNNGSEILTEDNVEGFSIRQIEDALQGKLTWNSWRDNIKNKYNNGTKNNLDALFAHWH